MDTFYQVGSVVLFFATIYVVYSGHKTASKKSEASLRAHYAAQGSAGDASKKMMQDAGYNI